MNDMLRLLYETKIGRLILKPLISRPVSIFSGKIMDSSFSKRMIPSFIRHNNINCDDYILDDIKCFNDFFCRKIKSGLREISYTKEDFISPCDAFLKIDRIQDDRVITAKQSTFTISSMLRDRKLAKSFEGGYCMVFRLCVDHYHRYIFFDSGKKYKDRKIKGFFHTVRPIALKNYPVFIENSREYSIIDTENFGRCVQMEVGALLVGRIVNEDMDSCMVLRGQEKGHFEYGGSTIIVLVKKDKIAFIDDYRDIIDQNIEIPVQMGQVIAEKYINK